MSGLDTLPPDQRAVLRLILAQGRGYAELAQLLKIDAGAVRTRAHAGLDALATAGDTPDDAHRAQIADYLLGQQDDGERLVTLVELGESAAACRWAAALRAQLLPLAREPLPEVPEPAPTTSHASAPPEPPSGSPQQPASTGPRPSRLGGAILLAAAAAVAIVLAVVLIGGNGNDGAASTSASTTPAQTGTQTSTTGSKAQIIGQANLLATPAGGQATGLGFVQQASGQTAIALQAQKLPANGADDIYAAWLSGTAGTKLLGFVPRQVKANGSLTVSAAFPQNFRQYDTVLITRESAAGGKVPTQPGVAIMRGTVTYR